MLSPRALVRRNPARAKFAAENCLFISATAMAMGQGPGQGQGKVIQYIFPYTYFLGPKYLRFS